MINDTNFKPQEERQSEVNNFRTQLAELQKSEGQQNVQEAINDNAIAEADAYDESQGSSDDTSDPTNYSDANEEQDFDDTDHDVDSGHMIPKGRFNKVIEQKKTLQKQIEEEKAKRIQAQTELDLYNKAMEKFLSTSSQNNQEPEQKGTQSFEPLDYEAHQHYLQQQSKLQQELDTIKQSLIQSQLTQVLTNQEQAFSRVCPDFNKAFEYLEEKYTQMYSSLCDTPEEARSNAKHQMGGMARKLLEKGENVAKVFYKTAKDFGYAPQDKGPLPNLEAVNQNMAKSKIANINSAPVLPSNGGSNYTRLEEFTQKYNPRDKNHVQTFQAMLKQLQKGK